MMPAKSLLQKSNHEFQEKYPHVCVGTLVSERITDILTKNSCFCSKAAFQNTKKDLMIKPILVSGKNEGQSGESIKGQMDLDGLRFYNKCVQTEVIFIDVFIKFGVCLNNKVHMDNEQAERVIESFAPQYRSLVFVNIYLI